MPSATNKLVVITGATRGLGRALTEEFVRLGHTVLGCGRSREVIADLQRKVGKPHHFAAVDVSDGLAVRQWAAGLLGSYRAPDLLINNAALINRNARLWEVPEEEFASVIGVNITGVAHVIRHFVPAMVAKQRGIIVNFSSGWGRSTAAEVAPYCATKWAIEGLTQALAQELPAGMAAVALNPGIIDTAMLRSCFGASAASYPSPEAWARTTVPFLLSLGPRQNGESLDAPS